MALKSCSKSNKSPNLVTLAGTIPARFSEFGENVDDLAAGEAEGGIRTVKLERRGNNGWAKFSKTTSSEISTLSNFFIRFGSLTS